MSTGSSLPHDQRQPPQPASGRWLDVQQIRQALRQHGLLATDVPTQHALSFPLPTRRWGEPGYAWFASPAPRVRGQPVVQGPPERWWVLHARRGNLVVYALMQVLSFAPDVEFGPIQLPPVERSAADQRQLLETVVLLVSANAPAFFDGETGDARARQALREALAAAMPAALVAQYRALVPDFYAWLEA